MKILQILTEVDVGDIEWSRSIMNKERAVSAQRQPALSGPGFWLLDAKTGKKLQGPFKDYDAARDFKRNRPDRIPVDAAIKPL